MREEVAEYKVVSNKEFLLLPEEEQDKQIVMKIRQSRLKAEQNKKKKSNTGNHRRKYCKCSSKNQKLL